MNNLLDQVTEELLEYWHNRTYGTTMQEQKKPRSDSTVADSTIRNAQINRWLLEPDDLCTYLF